VIFGTGFAPFRGGPIQYIRDTGAEMLLQRMKALEKRHGARFAARDGWDSSLLGSAQA
jgi:3-hydroxyacyl-CoA dehydrogenase/enoyl-CoA hydratase/3-hydroxybutyryl-CoA epimerase